MELLEPDLRDLVGDIMKEEDSSAEKFEQIEIVVNDKDHLKQFKRSFRELENELDSLKQLPDDCQGEMASLFREKSLGFDAKNDLLKHLVKGLEERRKCRRYLRQLEKKRLDDLLGSDWSDVGENEAKINVDFFEKCPETMNILILGETGVGKSTFINGLANYLKYKTMHESKQGVEVLITSYFTLTGEDMQQKKIVCKSEDDEGNENLEHGKSSTLKSKTYVFRWGPPGKEKQIQLIDTPGVGDVAGFERDRLNFDNIFTHLADYKELHGICVLMKPNESKLNTTFTYCLGELLSRLHISAHKNLLFCFTNTRGTLFRPGETLSILNAYMKPVEAKRKILIPLNRSSLFCFDNESFRFLVAWKDGMHFTEGHINDFNSSWKTSVEEVFRFFTRVSQLPPHDVRHTLCVNNVRKVLNIISKPMSKMSKQPLTIGAVVSEKKAQIATWNAELKTAQANTQQNQLTAVRKATGRVDTVCVKCSVPHPNNMAERQYNRMCHQNCACTRAKLETAQDVLIQRCACFNTSTLTCNTCGCLWNCHVQIAHELVVTSQKMTDTAVQSKLATLNQKIASAQKTIANAEKRKSDAEQENRKLKTLGSEFVAYLVKNAVLPYNEHTKEYIEKLISEEKGKVNQGKANKDFLYLEEELEAHLQQVDILSETTPESNKTSDEISDVVDKLKEEKDLGSIQGEIDAVIVLKPRVKPMIRSRVVDLNDGWLGEFFEGTS